ncbi:hypothetical protein J6590_104019, partial [Homalodisca vitripennis]
EYNKKHGRRSRSKPDTGREIIETVDEMNVDSENLGMGDNVSRDTSPNKTAESLVDKLPETNDPVMRMLIEMSRKQDEIGQKQDEVGRKQDEIREEVAKIGQRQEEACKQQEEMIWVIREEQIKFVQEQTKVVEEFENRMENWKRESEEKQKIFQNSVHQQLEYKEKKTDEKFF